MTEFFIARKAQTLSEFLKWRPDREMAAVYRVGPEDLQPIEDSDLQPISDNDLIEYDGGKPWLKQ